MHVNVFWFFLMHVLMLIGQGHGKGFALNVVLVLCLVVVEVHVMSFCTNVIMCNTVNM
jgi:hypothetical protein